MREKVGDILVQGESGAQILVDPDLVEHFETSLVQVGTGGLGAGAAAGGRSGGGDLRQLGVMAGGRTFCEAEAGWA